MNIFLWILQALLALHTAVGGVWKFGHGASETMPSLSSIPNGAWAAFGFLELFAAVMLVAPAINKRWALLAPVAAGFIATEMIYFTVLHTTAGNPEMGPVVYWLVVALVCAVIILGRLLRKRA